MTFEEAVHADRAGDLERAAGLYEEVLSSREPPLVSFANLAVLYWQCTDYGFWPARHLDGVFVRRAGARVFDVLKEACDLFPESREIMFWDRYIRWADLGAEFAVEQCEHLFRDAPNVLTPVMYLFTQSGSARYFEEAKLLLRECDEDRSVRAQYIASVLRSAFNRRSWANR